jgi:DNA-binding response OmpR family regulator
MTPDQPLAGLKVLVVEDDYYLADDARRALAEAGAEVLGPFAQSAAGVAAATESLGAAVLDINTGAGPSFEAAERLLAGGVRVLFVTGYDPDVIPAHLQHIPRLQKPVSEARLVAALTELRGG